MNNRIVADSQSGPDAADLQTRQMTRKPVCPNCNSDNVVADAAARWNVGSQSWDVSNVFDKGHGCDDCGATDIEFTWLDCEDQRATDVSTQAALMTELLAIVTTGHVTREEAQILYANGYSRGEYGWLLYIGRPHGPVVPEIARPSAGLTGVIERARERGCAYLLLDRNADAVQGISTYDW